MNNLNLGKTKIVRKKSNNQEVRQMISKKNKILILLLGISIGGSITSSIILIITPNSDTGSWSFNLTNNTEEQRSSCAISTDGKYIVVSSGNDYLYLFEKSSSTPLWSYRTDEGLESAEMSANGQYIVAREQEGTVYVFEKTNSNPIWTYSAGLSREILNVGISADGNYVFACEHEDLLLFNRNSNVPLWSSPSAGSTIVISSNGTYIVSVNYGLVKFYHKSNSTPLWQYDIGTPNTGALTITPNAEFFAVGGEDNKIHVFNKTGPVPIQIYSVDGIVRSLSISNEGNYISAACSDGVYLFEKSSPNRLWRNLTSDGFQTAISSDGMFIAFGGVLTENIQDYVYFFTRNSSNRLWEKKVINRVNILKMSSDGKIIAVAAGFNFYLLNSDNPTIDIFYEDKFNASVIGLVLFVGMGATTGVTYYILRVVQVRKEKIRLEKEKIERDIKGAIDILDGKYKEWNEEESEKI